MRNVRGNTAHTNEDQNSVLCDKELCEGTNKSFSCTRCEMHFTSMEKLTSHCETHKTAVKHICHVCEKIFASKGSLTHHQRIHSGERPYQCDVCDKRFTQKGNLATHLRIHTGERPWSYISLVLCLITNPSLADYATNINVVYVYCHKLAPSQDVREADFYL